jgi:hypothetical protein
VNSLERYLDALASVVARFARGDGVPTALERELATAEITAIQCGAPIELLDGPQRPAPALQRADRARDDRRQAAVARRGETTDKGYTNQRRVLERRAAAVVSRMYAYARRNNAATVGPDQSVLPHARAEPCARGTECNEMPVSRRKCGAIWLERAMVGARAPPHVHVAHPLLCSLNLHVRGTAHACSASSPPLPPRHFDPERAPIRRSVHAQTFLQVVATRTPTWNRARGRGARRAGDRRRRAACRCGCGGGPPAVAVMSALSSRSTPVAIVARVGGRGRATVPFARPTPAPKWTVAERELARIEHGRSRHIDQGSRIADDLLMPEPSFRLSRRTSRRGATLAVDARGQPAIAAPTTSAAGQVGEDLELGDRVGDIDRCQPGRRRRRGEAGRRHRR